MANPSPFQEHMRNHPCFSDEAHDRVGRVHLPVARRCNIRCLYCERRVCVHLAGSRPGWAERLLSPPEALEQVRALVRSHDSFVVGVAGPGEPLANPETLEALRLVHEAFPHLVKCLSTNGLRLEEALPHLLQVGVRALTVTLNAVDPAVGERIYAWVRYGGRLYRGREAAELLLERQLAGIQAALAAGLPVKVNTVLIPGVNDIHLPELAQRLAHLGVPLMNVMPLIPAGRMRERRAPTCDELRAARDACEVHLPQFRRCEQCRADVVALPRWGSGDADTKTQGHQDTKG